MFQKGIEGIGCKFKLKGLSVRYVKLWHFFFAFKQFWRKVVANI